MLRKILLEGKSHMGLNVGIVSRIHKEQYHVYAINTDYGGIRNGDIFELGNTYCKQVAANKRTMTFDDAGEISEKLKHPCYLGTQLLAYIGTPLIIDDRIWGTLNFSSRKPRKCDFSDADFRLVESLAEQVEQYLNSQNTLPLAN